MKLLVIMRHADGSYELLNDKPLDSRPAAVELGRDWTGAPGESYYIFEVIV